MSTGKSSHQDEIVVECELDAEPSKVFRALTQPEIVAEWLDARQSTCPSTEDGSTAKGKTYEILEATPFSLVRYAWHDRGIGRPTWVTFEIEPQVGGGTWFRLTHSMAPRNASTVPRAANANATAMMLAA